MRLRKRGITNKEYIPFLVGNTYSRKDIYRILEVPEEKQGGNWNTGYTTYKNDVFIFVNLNTSGRTGHDYDNKFIGHDLQWFSKKPHTLNSPTIQSMIKPQGDIYIFTRENNKDPNFYFQGRGKIKEYEDTRPVKIKWEFIDGYKVQSHNLAEEVTNPQKYHEGSCKTISVNIYERNTKARQQCIDYYGVSCVVCSLNFFETYGHIGKDFIHVHHLIPLHKIGIEYEVDPIKDLRPVCPNCHAMLHRRNPAYSIQELKSIINRDYD
ncbi:DUF3427 domain-containing protein [Bacillus megaterium]|nr:DUF3427 domain-containing protein [Priestia megaterium]NEW00666.1 DUF3427 domain-containing protein [Priestia megaterium]